MVEVVGGALGEVEPVEPVEPHAAVIAAQRARTECRCGPRPSAPRVGSTGRRTAGAQRVEIGGPTIGASTTIDARILVNRVRDAQLCRQLTHLDPRDPRFGGLAGAGGLAELTVQGHDLHPRNGRPERLLRVGRHLGPGVPCAIAYVGCGRRAVIDLGRAAGRGSNQRAGIEPRISILLCSEPNPARVRVEDGPSGRRNPGVMS